MRRVVVVVAVLLCSLNTPTISQAQTATEREEIDAAWAAFGTQLGFLLGSFTSAGLIVWADDQVGGRDLGGYGGALGLSTTLGMSASMGLGFAAIAEASDWSAQSGWAATGSMAGLYGAAFFSGGLMIMADVDDDAVGLPIFFSTLR